MVVVEVGYGFLIHFPHQQWEVVAVLQRQFAVAAGFGYLRLEGTLRLGVGLEGFGGFILWLGGGGGVGW